MHFELDDVVQDLFDLGVQFLAQGVGAEGQLFESRSRVSILVNSNQRGENRDRVLDVSVHLALLH